MHELSIAYSLVQNASEAAQQAGARKVNKVFLRLGKLSGVVKEALLFGYDIATKGTPLVIYCASPQCQQEFAISGLQGFRCPKCNQPSNQIRQGRELEIEKLEIEVD